MKFLEDIRATGEVTIIRTNQDNVINGVFVFPNLVVTTGKAYIASRMVNASATAMGWMGIGAPVSVTGAVVGDTALQTQVGRVALNTYSASGAVITATATFPAGTGTGAITEAGIFNVAVTGGTMLCRTTFPVVSKAAGDSIAINWVITIA